MTDTEILASAKRHATSKDGAYAFYLTQIQKDLGIENYSELRRRVMELGAVPMDGLGQYTIAIDKIPDTPPQPADSRDNGSHNRSTSNFVEPSKVGIPASERIASAVVNPPKTSTALVPVESEVIPPVAPETDTNTEVPPDIVLEPNAQGVYEAVDGQRQTIINAAVIPDELKTRRQWVMWRWATREGENKPTKPPYKTSSRSLNRGTAKNDTPSTWTTFEEAYAQSISDTPNFGIKPNDGRDPGPECGKLFSGIGYVFSADDPYCGIDVDNCLKPDGTPKRWATPIIDRLRPVAYLEVSPSGTGMKAWTKAVLPPNSRKVQTIGDGKIEAYDSGRYFTVTTEGATGVIGEGQVVVDWIYATYFPKPETKEPKPARGSPTRPAKPFTSDVSELVRQIRNSKQGAKFDKLFNGNWADYKVGTEGASRADEALCCMIAFWTQDASQIDAVFRQSKLMRQKWDEKHRGDGATYGQMTIEFALKNLRETRTTKGDYVGQPRTRRGGLFNQRRTPRNNYKASQNPAGLRGGRSRFNRA